MAADLEDKLDTVVRQRNERDAILSSMVEGVLAIDGDERLLRMNDAAARLLGVDAGRAEGRSLPEIVRSIDLHKLVAAVISTQQPVEGEVVLRDREPRFLHVHGTVLRDAPEGRSGALLVIHDVTDLKRLESIRRDFVANVSHELKTPVTSIQGYVETLLDGAMNDAEQREKFLKIVAKHTERLHAILEDLLTLARVEQEGEKPPERARPRTAAGRAGSGRCRLRREGRGKEHAGPVDLPRRLAAAMNASLLEQAVVNLIENAIAYSPPGQTVEVSGLAGERRDRDPRPRPRLRHQPRAFAADLRAVLPRRQVAEPRIRRHRPGAGHRQAHRPAPRRPDRRGKRPGRGQHVLDFPAEVRRYAESSRLPPGVASLLMQTFRYIIAPRHVRAVAAHEIVFRNRGESVAEALSSYHEPYTANILSRALILASLLEFWPADFQRSSIAPNHAQGCGVGMIPTFRLTTDRGDAKTVQAGDLQHGRRRHRRSCTCNHGSSRDEGCICHGLHCRPRATDSHVR